MEGAGKVIARVLLRQEYKADVQVMTLAGAHIDVHTHAYTRTHMCSSPHTQAT